MPGNTPWSEYEDAVLKQMFASGKSVKAMVLQLGRTRDAVYNRLLLWGLRLRDRT